MNSAVRRPRFAPRCARDAVDEVDCCLCGEPARHDAHAVFYAVRFEAGMRVTTLRRAGVSLCDACADEVRGFWRTRRLIGVGALAAILGGMGAAALAISAFEPALPTRIVLLVASLGVALAPLAAMPWLRDRRRELHDRVAARYDVDAIFDGLERHSGPANGVSFELALGRAEGKRRLEALVRPLRSRPAAERRR